MCDDFYFPDRFTINQKEYQGSINIKNGIVIIPCTEKPSMKIGDTIFQTSGEENIPLIVTHEKYTTNSSGNIGTKHNNIIEIKIKTMEEESKSVAFNIGTITGVNQLQIGNNSTQTNINITLKEVIEKIAASDDPQAKSLLKALFENPTVASIAGGLMPLLVATGIS